MDGCWREVSKGLPYFIRSVLIGHSIDALSSKTHVDLVSPSFVPPTNVCTAGVPPIVIRSSFHVKSCTTCDCDRRGDRTQDAVTSSVVG